MNYYEHQYLLLWFWLLKRIYKIHIICGYWYCITARILSYVHVRVTWEIQCQGKKSSFKHAEDILELLRNSEDATPTEHVWAWGWPWFLPWTAGPYPWEMVSTGVAPELRTCPVVWTLQSLYRGDRRELLYWGIQGLCAGAGQHTDWSLKETEPEAGSCGKWRLWLLKKGVWL